ncbi:MAG: Na+/H+ antiporter NhaA, partial [Gammaproteobacteria bacterium]
MIDEFRRFLKLEAAGGIILLVAASLAIVFANTPLSTLYSAFITLPVEVRIGALHIDKPLLLWINDGLMAIFFLLVGLELKREFLEGELSRPSQLVLPGLGALGGMLMPALIYAIINRHDPIALQGWAIPAATDIAFALGILALLGSRVPASLKIFLVALAILDDIGAIIIIAIFYTTKLSVTALAISGACCTVLFLLNRRRISNLAPYLITGIIMWVAVLKSGVHATLAGVILAFFIPMRSDSSKRSPLRNLEHDLNGTVAFFVLPVFAFVNA